MEYFWTFREVLLAPRGLCPVRFHGCALHSDGHGRAWLPSLVSKREFILVKTPSLAVGKPHWPTDSPRWCSYVVQACFKPGAARPRGRLASAPSRAGSVAADPAGKALCSLVGLGPSGLPPAEPALPPPAPGMLTQVKVSGSWQRLNLSCWPKLKLNNLLFAALWNQVSEPRLRRYLFSYTSKGMLPKMRSHFVSLFWWCGLAQVLMHSTPASSLSTQKQMSKAISVQTEY